MSPVPVYIKDAMIQDAGPKDQRALVPMERCPCGRLAPAPGYAPLGAYTEHCLRYHDPATLRRFAGYAIRIYCAKCRLCRVKTQNEVCLACLTTEQRQVQHRALQEKEAISA